METNLLQVKEEALYYDVDIPESRGSQYSNQDKFKAALFYTLYGNIRRVSELLSVPERTIYDWYKSEWWEKLTKIIREENKTELNANYSRLLDKTIQHIEKQIDNQEVKALDLAKIHGIMFDKRQILNNMPTSISGKTKEISDLAAEFNRFVQAKTIDVKITETESN